MEQGLKEYHDIKKDYYSIDSQYINGDLWELYEHSWYGDETKAIAVNVTKKYFLYTWESLQYIADNMDEFTLYKL